MVMDVKQFMSLKLGLILNVTLLFLQLMSLYFNPGTHHFLWLKTIFGFLLPPYVRVKNSGVKHINQTNIKIPDNCLDSSQDEVKTFSFLPNMIFEKHEEYKYLRLVEEIISNGMPKDDRTGTGTLSKFGCQVIRSINNVQLYLIFFLLFMVCKEVTSS